LARPAARVDVLSHYQRSWIRGDVLAGVTAYVAWFRRETGRELVLPTSPAPLLP
jgi:MFS superfamily sulfate permease-like transporter